MAGSCQITPRRQIDGWGASVFAFLIRHASRRVRSEGSCVGGLIEVKKGGGHFSSIYI